MKEDGTGLYAANVSVRNGKQGRLFLRNFSLALNKGDFAVVLGHSCSGKSALIHALAGQASFSSGKVLLGGNDPVVLLETFPLSIALLSARTNFPKYLTADEILNYAAEFCLPRNVSSPTVRSWLHEIAKLTGLLPFLQTRAGGLTASQLARLALAESLVGDPEFILADELTSGLDPHTDYQIMQCLRTFASQYRKTIVFSTQQMKSIHLCDKIIFLHQGQCTFQGNFDQLWSAHQTKSTRELYGFYHEASVTQRAISSTYAGLPVEPKPQAVHSAEPPSALRRAWVSLRRGALNLYRGITPKAP